MLLGTMVAPCLKAPRLLASCCQTPEERWVDGEIVCLARRGRPRFNDLLFHRGEPCFFSFDLLMDDGKDLRRERLIDRKQELRRLLTRNPMSRLRYVEHIEHHGKALFQRVCKMDLEGIVAKHSFGPYTTEGRRTTWIKIKNRQDSQMQGREKLFEGERQTNLSPAAIPVIWPVQNRIEQQRELRRP